MQGVTIPIEPIGATSRPLALLEAVSSRESVVEVQLAARII
jgi:hypothetical protein